MAVSRVVQARTRLRERRKEQQAALTVASRSADAVEAAQARRRELVEQGSRLVADAQAAHQTAVASLVRAMGSVELAASMLDVDEAAVRKAVAAESAARKSANRAAREPRPKPAPAPSTSGPAQPTSAAS